MVSLQLGDPGNDAAPYLTYFPLVVLSAWFGVFGRGVVTIALGALFAPHPWGLVRFVIRSVSFGWLHPRADERCVMRYRFDGAQCG